MSCWSGLRARQADGNVSLMHGGFADKRQKTKQVQCASESKTKMDGSRYSAKYLGK